jgi:hypothetical protein
MGRQLRKTKYIEAETESIVMLTRLVQNKDEYFNTIEKTYLNKQIELIFSGDRCVRS